MNVPMHRLPIHHQGRIMKALFGRLSLGQVASPQDAHREVRIPRPRSYQRVIACLH